MGNARRPEQTHVLYQPSLNVASAVLPRIYLFFRSVYSKTHGQVEDCNGCANTVTVAGIDYQAAADSTGKFGNSALLDVLITLDILTLTLQT